MKIIARGHDSLTETCLAVGWFACRYQTGTGWRHWRKNKRVPVHGLIVAHNKSVGIVGTEIALVQIWGTDDYHSCFPRQRPLGHCIIIMYPHIPVVEYNSTHRMCSSFTNVPSPSPRPYKAHDSRSSNASTLSTIPSANSLYIFPASYLTASLFATGSQLSTVDRSITTPLLQGQRINTYFITILIACDRCQWELLFSV
jgi:hypothetical protein